MNSRTNRATIPLQIATRRAIETAIQHYLGFISDITMAAGFLIVLTLLEGVPTAVVLQAVAVFAVLVTGIVLLQRHYHLDHHLNPADRVTLARVAITAACAGLLFQGQAAVNLGWWLPVIAGVALILDGVDGWLARRTGTASTFGGRFDMETDAFFILVLSGLVWQLDKVEVWVLAIGAMRYIFVAATTVHKELAGTLPARRRRQIICVAQVVALIVCLLPLTDPGSATIVASMAIAALSYSFAVDIIWLHRRR